MYMACMEAEGTSQESIIFCLVGLGLNSGLQACVQTPLLAVLLFLRWDLAVYQASLYLQWLSHLLPSGVVTGGSRIPFQSSC